MAGLADPILSDTIGPVVEQNLCGPIRDHVGSVHIGLDHVIGGAFLLPGRGRHQPDDQRDIVAGIFFRRGTTGERGDVAAYRELVTTRDGGKRSGQRTRRITEAIDGLLRDALPDGADLDVLVDAALQVDDADLPANGEDPVPPVFVERRILGDGIEPGVVR